MSDIEEYQQEYYETVERQAKKVDFQLIESYADYTYISGEKENLKSYIIVYMVVKLFDIFAEAEISLEDELQDEFQQRIEENFQRDYNGDPENIGEALLYHYEDIMSDPDVFYSFVEDKFIKLLNDLNWIEYHRTNLNKEGIGNFFLTKLSIKYNFREIEYLRKLPEETIESYETEFYKNIYSILEQMPQVHHIIRFYDDNVLKSNSALLPDIYKMETGIREILTFILLETFGLQADPYDLLGDFNIEKFKKENNKEFSAEDLSKYYENELFLISFTKYKDFLKLASYDNSKFANLITSFLKEKTSKRKPNPSDLLIEMTNLNEDEIKKIRRKITPEGISFEYYKGFIAGLQDYMPVIEQVRNCIAHNRFINKDLKDSYDLSSKALFSHIDGFWKDLAVNLEKRK